MSRSPLVAGNWKMHGALATSAPLVSGLRGAVEPDSPVRVVLCPPYPYLKSVVDGVGDCGIAVGAQDLSRHTGQGAYTGEVSGGMLSDVGCRYVIVGHSERRSLLGETDTIVAAKFEAAQAAGLKPILCVGESLAQREADHTEAVVRRQVETVVDAVGAGAFADAVIAYEPLWAIGTGKTASPAQAEEVHATIRAIIASEDDIIAAGLPIVYGGSVKAGNAAELLAMPNIDGGLVGGASLDVAEFVGIFRAAASQVDNY